MRPQTQDSLMLIKQGMNKGECPRNKLQKRNPKNERKEKLGLQGSRDTAMWDNSTKDKGRLGQYLQKLMREVEIAKAYNSGRQLSK